ncbi:hypothetical protein Tco_1295688, partial [Tanacetum coccineum]
MDGIWSRYGVRTLEFHGYGGGSWWLHGGEMV